MTSQKSCAGFGAMWRAWPCVAAFCAVFFGMTSAASAELIRVSATTFALRTSAGSTDVVGEGGAGLLQNAKGSYFASVRFPTAGSVCRFNLIYRDFDVDFQITARLMKKIIVVGGNAFAPPVTMATVRTGVATASDVVMRKGTSVITQPTTPSEAFYFVQLDVPATTLQILGVEIVHLATCP